MDIMTHYADIYDLDDKHHREPRWDAQDNVYRYYEGYGQRDCREKKDFMESINRDHPVWSCDTPEKKEIPVFSVPGNKPTHNLPWSPPLAPTQSWDVGFRRESKVLYIGDKTTQTENIDDRDRKNRLSWNFSKMLCDYYEKAVGKEKDIFFKEDGVGSVWSKDMKLMEEFGPLFENISLSLEDVNFKISLSDQTVKGYPRHSFTDLKEKYEKFMKEKKTKEFKFNPMAKEFTMPQKPDGPPPPRRPSASSKESSSLLVWDMKQQSDKKIDNLEKKLDLLISMNGPVIEAEQI